MSFDRHRLQTLCENLIEDGLLPDARQELERMVLASPRARRFYLDYMANHVAMIEYFEAFPMTDARIGRPAGTRRCVAPSDAPVNPLIVRTMASPRRRPSFWAKILVASVLFSGLIVCAILFDPPGISPTETLPDQAESQSFGTITSLNDGEICHWTEDSDALRIDGRFGAGELRLLSGIGLIHYDHGATLIVKSPAQLTMHSRERCFLHSGRVFARVDPEAIGFTVETSVAAIKDLGTEFGVNVREGENADVQVFSGRVDVQRTNQTDIIPITTGGWLRFGERVSSPQASLFANQDRSTLLGNEIVCSTADENGREACVVAGGDPDRLNPQLISLSNIFTLIKNGSIPDCAWHRKAYFSIDLAKLSTNSFRDVQLELAFAPTGVGFISYMPQVSAFTIYGLIDEQADDWNEETIHWNNAPANRPGGKEIDPEKVMKIATFEIPRDQEVCRKIISNPELRNFLSRDTDQRVTFIVVRETEELSGSGYAHGFANRHHPKLPPPTLRFYQ